MKLLLVTPMLPQPQPANAVALVNYAQLQALRAAHDVTLVTFVGPDQDERVVLDELRAAGVTVHALWRPELTGLRRWGWRWQVVRRWPQGREPLRTLWFRDRAMQRLIDRTLAHTSFDVVQVEDNAMAQYHYRTNAPLVLTEHEVRVPQGVDQAQPANSLQRAWERGERRRWQRYQPAVWQRFGRIQVFTAQDAAAISVIAPTLAERVRTNPFGIIMPPPADPEHEEPNTLVFVGGFLHPPNVDAVLWLGHEIMPRLRARGNGARLTIVGSYPPPAVCALAAPDITITGRVPAVEPWLERAALVVAPLRMGGGQRMKVLQALALGKAVVTTPLGTEGLRINGHAPPLFTADTADGIADALTHLLANDADRRMLGQQARQFVALHHSAEAYGRRLAAIYAELVPQAVA